MRDSSSPLNWTLDRPRSWQPWFLWGLDCPPLIPTGVRRNPVWISFGWETGQNWQFHSGRFQMKCTPECRNGIATGIDRNGLRWVFFFFSFVELIITYGQISCMSHHTALPSPSQQPNLTPHRGQTRTRTRTRGRGGVVGGMAYQVHCIFLSF